MKIKLIILMITVVIATVLFFRIHNENAYAWNYHPVPTATPTPIPTSRCKPTVKPSPTPTATPYPSKSPYPTQTPDETPLPSVAPSETPIPTSVDDSPPVYFQDNLPPSNSCNAPVDAPKLQGFKEEANGDVTFSWWPSMDTSVTSQSIVYGCSPDQLVYGVNGLDKNVSSFTIHGLSCPGMKWAQVWSNSNGCSTKSNVLDP